MAKRHHVLGFLTTCAALALATAALADPPERVGRVRHVEGDVSFTPPGEQDWTDVERNYPVTSGEGYWTGDDGRLELQVGGISARLDNLTELDVVDLDYGRTRLALSQGSVDLRVWRAPRGGIVVETPAGEVRIDQPGVYRLDVAAPPDDGSYPPVQFTVFEGSGVAPGGYGPMEIDAGQSAMLYAGYDPQLQEAEDAAIDDWARDREARERWTERVDNDDTAITGYDDLAAYGEFTDDPNYGQVWYPRNVPADWAPYRDGHWAYVQPWGWTWIDDQPWGFAPFHYGRWAQIGGRWAWVRGAPSREPVYAPALVAFVGGAGWRIGLSLGGGGGGGGAVGWVPLAPDEVYRPSYRVSDTYVRQVNITNVRNTTVINNITINNAGPPPSRLRNVSAATVVRTEAFAHGGAVQHAAIPVPPQTLASAPAAGPAPIAAPDRAARLGGLKPPAGGPGRPPGVPGAAGAPPVVHAPPPRLGAIRSALTRPVAPQPPGGPAHPPPIPGLHAPAAQGGPPPRREGPALVAPSQLRNPQAQHQRPVTPGATSGAPTAVPNAERPHQPGQSGSPPFTEHRAPPSPAPAGVQQTQPQHPQGFNRPPTTAPGAPQGEPQGEPTGPRPHHAPPTPSMSEPSSTGGPAHNPNNGAFTAPPPERHVAPPPTRSMPPAPEPPRRTPPPPAQQPPAPRPTAAPPKPPPPNAAARPRPEPPQGDKGHGDKPHEDKAHEDKARGDKPDRADKPDR